MGFGPRIAHRRNQAYSPPVRLCKDFQPARSARPACRRRKQVSVKCAAGLQALPGPATAASRDRSALGPALVHELSGTAVKLADPGGTLSSSP